MLPSHIEGITFQPTDSLEVEMAKFQKIMNENSTYGKELLSIGTNLVNYARDGNVSQLLKLINNLPNEFPKNYFSIQIFMTSLQNNNFFITSYLLGNGYPINEIGYPSPYIHYFKEIYKNICEKKKIIEHENDLIKKENLIQILKEDINNYDLSSVNMLNFIKKFGFNINHTEDKTYYSALHYAALCELEHTIYNIVFIGGDVNVVGCDDVMPLNIVNKIENEELRTRISNFLVSNGARDTWRRSGIIKDNNSDRFSTSVYTTPSTSSLSTTNYKPSFSFSSGTNDNQLTQELERLRIQIRKEREAESSININQEDNSSTFTFSTGNNNDDEDYNDNSFMFSTL